MRVSFTNYKNSKLATILSAFGSLLTVGGLLMVVTVIFSVISGETSGAEEIIGSLLTCAVFSAIGVGLMFLASAMASKKNEKAAYEKWIYIIESKGYKQTIVDSVDAAIAIYNLYPAQESLNYIAKLNPEAADIIREANKQQ